MSKTFVSTIRSLSIGEQEIGKEMPRPRAKWAGCMSHLAFIHGRIRPCIPYRAIESFQGFTQQTPKRPDWPSPDSWGLVPVRTDAKKLGTHRGATTGVRSRQTTGRLPTCTTESTFIRHQAHSEFHHKSHC
jgi:hypothetical protein